MRGNGRCLTRLMPELAHIYPVYRLHITSGRIAAADVGTLRDACAVIQRLTASGPAPRAGTAGRRRPRRSRAGAQRRREQRRGHRLLQRLPYNQRHPVHTRFIRRNGLVEARWSRLAEAKAELVRAYGSQVQALFPGGRIPLVPEVFFSVPPSAHPCPEALAISRGRAQVTTTRIRPASAAARHARPRAGEARPSLPRSLVLRPCSSGWRCMSRGFDLYGDEVIYTDLGRSVISGGFPQLRGAAVLPAWPRLFLP